VHEYGVGATIAPDTLEVLTIDATPRVLPWPECPAAADSVASLVGRNLRGVRTIAGEELRGLSTCTHLNDTLRTLEDVPALALRLPAPARR
jgi:hypothetical protein